MTTKVLLADDEEDVKIVLKMYLETKGYEVVTAYDGLDAIDVARREKPNVILLDLMMPVIDGFEVCRRLKADAATQQIPIIMVSAASHAESVQKGLAAGAVDYIVKPFEPESLEKLLSNVLARA
ncbi:response regulator [bacterium]|nr:response regulator [bacterium]